MIPTTVFCNISTPKPSRRKTATSLKSQHNSGRVWTGKVHHHNYVNTTQKNPNSWPTAICLQSPPTNRSAAVSASPAVQAEWLGLPTKTEHFFSWLLLHQHSDSTQHGTALPRNRTSAPSSARNPHHVLRHWSTQSYRTISAPPTCSQGHLRKQNFPSRRPGEGLCANMHILHSPWTACGKNLLCEHTPIFAVNSKHT